VVKRMKPTSCVDVLAACEASPAWPAAASARHMGSPVAWYISQRLPGKKPLVPQAASDVVHGPEGDGVSYG
jgi:hypothetical protein